MNQIVLLIFLISISSYQVFGHGGEDHKDANVEIQTEVDEDGFEIISTAPSKEILEKINTGYLKSVKKIFSNKCLSCHGVNNSPPWYYHIPGPKQLMDHDMREAKKHMDMSNDFPFGGHGSPVDDLNAIEKTIKKGSMPPLRYRLMHWDSRPTEEEKKSINEWIIRSKMILNKE